jgi:hypothetical protein
VLVQLVLDCYAQLAIMEHLECIVQEMHALLMLNANLILVFKEYVLCAIMQLIFNQDLSVMKRLAL